MEGIELLRQTRDVMQTLSDKINTAGIQSSFTEGRYHHFIAHGMDIPSSFAYGFFRELVEEAEKSPDVLSRLPMDKVQEVYNKAKEAIDTGIEASIAYLADALRIIAIYLSPFMPSTAEKIWQQLIGMAPAGAETEKKAQFVLNPKDTRIINQICSGNFERIAELTNISSRAARCLARTKGSELFLNGLMTLSPEAAQQLFQWQGNWICLNGLKNLSPAAAQYLFGWQGNWISLNGLSDFPPDVAKHLLKWEGRQLELMGLKYNPNEATQKTLNYLILWETAGGKVFVTDNVRQKMESLM